MIAQKQPKKTKYDPEFNRMVREYWHERYEYYPGMPIHDNRLVDTTEDCIENDIRDIFLMLEDVPLEYMDALHVERQVGWVDFESNEKFTKLTFKWNDVDVVLYHEHGFKYVSGWEKFFGIRARCYSFYDCWFKYNGRLMPLDQTAKRHVLEDICKEFSSELKELNDDFDQKMFVFDLKEKLR